MLKVLVIVGVVGLVALAGMGFLVWRVVAAPAQWREYESPRGGFAVELPAAPRDDMANRIGFPQRPGTTVEGTMRRNTVYTVTWSDFPGARNAWVTDDQILDGAMNGMQQEFTRDQFTKPEPITVDGFAGRETVVTIPGEGTYVFRVVIAETRLYIIAVGGPKGSAEHPDVRRFLDSFRITDQTLKAPALKRAEDARKKRESEEAARVAEARRVEEARLAAERAAARVTKQKELTEKIKAANEAYLQVEYAGPKVPKPSAVGRNSRDVFTYAFEREGDRFGGAGGVEVYPEGWASGGGGFLPNLTPAQLGPGVRGKAAYLTSETRAAALNNDGPAVYSPFHAIKHPYGYTLAGWVRVRYQPITLVSVYAREGPADPPLAEITVGRTHILAQAVGRTRRIELKHAWNRDEKWHHIALVQGVKPENAGVKLYLDGELVASAEVEAVPLPQRLAAGIGWLKYKDPDWTGFPDVDGNPAPPVKDEVVGAIDDCAFIARPLSANEVRMLVGKARPDDVADRTEPPPPIGLTFVPGKKLPPVAAVAFDPARRVVWTVDDGQPARLRKLSFPGFEEKATYLLPGGVSAAAFDLPRNRLYLAVVGNDLYVQPEKKERLHGVAALHRYDLDTLGGFAGKRIEPDEESSAKFVFEALAVVPDGKTVYFTAQTRDAVRASGFVAASNYESHLYRTSDTFSAPEKLNLPTKLHCPQRFELSPDGQTILIHSWGGGGSGKFNLLAVDTQQWKERVLNEDAAAAFDWVSVSEKRQFVCSARNRLVLPGGSADPANQYLAVLAERQYILTSESDRLPNNRVRVFCTYGQNEPRVGWGVWAEMTSTPEVPVGGAFWISQDCKYLVFRSGQVVRLDAKLELAADPEAVKRLVALPPAAVGTARAPLPHVKPPFRDVPPATDCKGLLLYLPCDTAEKGKMIDAVTQESVGALLKGELVPGPRGQAIRLTHFRRFGADPLSALTVNVPPIEEGKPFTLAFWVRRDPEAIGDGGTDVVRGSKRLSATESRWVSFRIHEKAAGFNLGHAQVGKAAMSTGAGGPVEDVLGWNHYALSRDADGKLRLHINGKPMPLKHNPVDKAPLDYGKLEFAYGRSAPLVIDIDEVCLFDRALTDDEVKRLAGRTEK